jgi:hypothetical protein
VLSQTNCAAAGCTSTTVASSKAANRLNQPPKGRRRGGLPAQRHGEEFKGSVQVNKVST